MATATLQQLDDITLDPELSSPRHQQQPGADEDEAQSKETQQTEGQHMVSSGGELVPSTPLGDKLAKTVLIIGLLTFICGLCIVSLGVAITGYFKFRASRSCPVLWWAGLPAILMGATGMFVGARKNRKNLLYWGIWGLIVVITTVSIMVVADNLSVGRYSVWPPISQHKGQDLCKVINATCFCQNVYQGVYSERRTPNIRYFHIDLWWKDTGFADCEDVYMMARLYYSAMFCIGVYFILCVCGISVGFAGSICVEPETETFRRLEEDPEEESPVGKAYTINVSNGKQSRQKGAKEMDDFPHRVEDTSQA